MSHTKEHLSLGGTWEENFDGTTMQCAGIVESENVIAAAFDEDFYIAKERARRIVACVNFCTGIPTNELELISSNERDKCIGLYKQHFDLHHVRKERDQLRLEYITSVGETQRALEQRDTYRDLCAELLDVMKYSRDWLSAISDSGLDAQFLDRINNAIKKLEQPK